MKGHKFKYWTVILIVMFGIGIMAVSCSEKPESHWSFKEVLELQGIAPVGIAVDGNFIWLSDPDHKRVVKADLKGEVLEEIRHLERPMHIARFSNKLYVPEYLNDSIGVFGHGSEAYLPIKAELDAPAGVAVIAGSVAIADFYNHRVVLIEDGHEISLGGEGHAQGELYYPTDVEIDADLVYVADAYNNRVQVFDMSGKNVRTIGENDHIQVASGIAITENELFVADFDGNRILIYSKSGELLQELKQGIVNPTDIAYHDYQIFIANYGNKSIAVFSKNQ